VLEALSPPERLAFVLHDMFAVPFDEIAPIVDRSPEATRQLASRARRRVQGERAVPDVDVDSQREVVEAFLAAAREGDFEALVAVLDPDARSCGRISAAALRRKRSAALRRSRARRRCTRGSVSTYGRRSSTAPRDWSRSMRVARSPSEASQFAVARSSRWTSSPTRSDWDGST